MQLSKKISLFLTQLLMIFMLIPWLLSLGFSIIVFGIILFSYLLYDASNMPPLSLLFKKNKNFGEVTTYSYTKKEINHIYDKNGYKVGSYETNGKRVTYDSTDNREYSPRYFYIILYLLYYPINRVAAIVLSFAALFSNKFYVSIKIPEDCKSNPYKYNRLLYTLFNVIYERDEVGIDNYQKRVEYKKIKTETLKNNIHNLWNSLKTTHKEKVMLGIKLAVVAIIIAIILLIILL